ncbi:nitrilase-related carbon-nitrogen hydrolase [Georgenia subflava]|uniref:Carbon-nitrogen family hydrolase n=1 Tax=Georgenia subflava TaxID=1622177 RepID=A0A6N7EE71_9MICO|nr:nitrilase-related carbon-nitrogen hydrolase [Georgenia subflava]MPV35503.1 carbon-nitrogen family hydrolase [Georgenia subflava]
MRIGLVQVASPDGESPKDRRARVADMIRSAEPCDLYVLPELWAAGYFSFDEYIARAEPLDGPTVRTLAGVAAERDAFLHVGSLLEDRDQGRVRNTAVLLDRSGTPVSKYSKIHVFGYQSAESQLLEPGDKVEVTPTEYGTVASTTCYDLRFPGLWQLLSELGTEIAVVPAAWPAARLAHWKLFTSARAVEHQMFVIACNAAGTQHGTLLGGHSRVVDPWGEVVLELGADEEVGICEIDPGQVSVVRREFPVLADRLPSYQMSQQKENV